LGWVVGCNLGGERWDRKEEGEEEGEIEEKSVGRVGIYWLLPMESPTDTFRRYTSRWFHRWKCHITIRLSRFESLVNSIGKIVWKNPRHHTIATFQKNCIVRQRYGRYIPTVSIGKYQQILRQNYFRQ
jgi:hypothetical protein